MKVAYTERFVDLFATLAAVEAEIDVSKIPERSAREDTYRFSWMSSRTSNQTQHYG